MSEWGWNPETFGAIGTVGATLVGTIALLLASSQLRMASRQLRMVNKDLDLKAQARMMHVRMIRDSRSLDMFAATSQKTCTDGHWIEWANDKGSPDAYAVDVELSNDSHSDIHLLGLVSVGGYPIDGKSQFSISMKNGWRRGVRIQFGFANSVLTSGDKYYVRLPMAAGFSSPGELIGIRFRDADGILWTRRLDGTLIEGEMKMVPGYSYNGPL
ncbi:hypothetical protein [Arthrobacter sp. KNU40]|uniref:hypothetical protein n=1 Tax=Arthrobacter sp. KNU40 TaxID=3447965 RepID=UPI003F62D715